MLAKGYEQTAIQDVLSELNISSGAFYHYFGSKPELLEALVERIREESGVRLQSIVRDSHLSTPEKLAGFFRAIGEMRVERQAVVVEILQIWYADSNTIVRQKVEDANTGWTTPLVTEIVREYTREYSRRRFQNSLVALSLPLLMVWTQPRQGISIPRRSGRADLYRGSGTAARRFHGSDRTRPESGIQRLAAGERRRCAFFFDPVASPP